MPFNYFFSAATLPGYVFILVCCKLRYRYLSTYYHSVSGQFTGAIYLVLFYHRILSHKLLIPRQTYGYFQRSKWDSMRWHAISALAWTGKNPTIASFPRSIIPVRLNGLNTSQKSQVHNWNYATN